MTRRGPKRWVVRSERATLASVLGRLEIGVGALEEGRAFVDGRRAGDPSSTLRGGSVVDVYPQRPPVGSVAVLDRREGIVVASKPAPAPTEPDRSGYGACVVSAVASQLDVDWREVHAIGRLDVGVSGAVVLATGRAASRRLSRLQTAARIRRRYVAIVRGAPAPPAGSWELPVDGRPACSRYRTVATAATPLVSIGRGGRRSTATASMLAVELRTGRHHQVRAQAARSGAPLYGDRRYGGPRRLVGTDGSVTTLNRVALHCAFVEIHGLGSDPWRVHDPIPDPLAQLWTAFGGGDQDWNDALHVAPLG